MQTKQELERLLFEPKKLFQQSVNKFLSAEQQQNNISLSQLNIDENVHCLNMNQNFLSIPNNGELEKAIECIPIPIDDITMSSLSDNSYTSITPQQKREIAALYSKVPSQQQQKFKLKSNQHKHADSILTSLNQQQIVEWSKSNIKHPINGHLFPQVLAPSIEVSNEPSIQINQPTHTFGTFNMKDMEQDSNDYIRVLQQKNHQSQNRSINYGSNQSEYSEISQYNTQLRKQVIQQQLMINELMNQMNLSQKENKKKIEELKVKTDEQRITIDTLKKKEQIWEEQQNQLREQLQHEQKQYQDHLKQQQQSIAQLQKAKKNEVDEKDNQLQSFKRHLQQCEQQLNQKQMEMEDLKLYNVRFESQRGDTEKQCLFLYIIQCLQKKPWWRRVCQNNSLSCLRRSQRNIIQIRSSILFNVSLQQQVIIYIYSNVTDQFEYMVEKLLNTLLNCRKELKEVQQENCKLNDDINVRFEEIQTLKEEKEKIQQNIQRSQTEHQSQQKQQNKAMKESQKQLDTLQQQLEKLENALTIKEYNTEEAQDKIMFQQQQVSQMQQYIEKLEQVLKQVKEKENQLFESISQKDEQIELLKSQINEQNQIFLESKDLKESNIDQKPEDILLNWQSIDPEIMSEEETVLMLLQLLTRVSRSSRMWKHLKNCKDFTRLMKKMHDLDSFNDVTQEYNKTKGKMNKASLLSFQSNDENSGKENKRFQFRKKTQTLVNLMKSQI